jgi:hypothetical protein
MNILKKPQTWMGSMDKQPEWQNMDKRFGTWNVGSSLQQID